MKYLIFVAIFAFSFQILNALNCISKRNSKCLDSVKYCMYINYMDENGINHVEQSCASPITLGGKIFTCEDYGTTTINFKNINGKMICCDTNMCNNGNDPGTTTIPKGNDDGNTAERVMGKSISCFIVFINIVFYINFKMYF